MYIATIAQKPKHTNCVSIFAKIFEYYKKIVISSNSFYSNNPKYSHYSNYSYSLATSIELIFWVDTFSGGDKNFNEGYSSFLIYAVTKVLDLIYNR